MMQKNIITIIVAVLITVPKISAGDPMVPIPKTVQPVAIKTPIETPPIVSPPIEKTPVDKTPIQSPTTTTLDPCGPQVLCTNIHAPVCATDGKTTTTFDNECLFNKAKCVNKKLKILYDGECKETCPDKDPCPDFCSEIYSPVCATDGKTTTTYSNECFFDKAKCKNKKLKLLYDGECRVKCPLQKSPDPCGPEVFCTDIYEPVCATDGDTQTTFPNRCEFRKAKCDKSLCILHEGECKETCPKFCPLYYDPVCATDGKTTKTYSNICFFNIAKCKNKKWRVLYDGECRVKCPLEPVDGGSTTTTSCTSSTDK